MGVHNRLTCSAMRMHARHLDPMIDDLHASLGRPIMAAWNAKEDLLDLLALTRPHPDRHVIADRLFRFCDRYAACGLPELHRQATTIETWWPEILAFIRTGITNAGAEGTNRVVKAIARDVYGFRNPETQRYALAAQPPEKAADTSTPLKLSRRARTRPVKGRYVVAIKVRVPGGRLDWQRR
ncbi:transposase [Nonomuraea sp. NPDC050680]|uniref:transposase n=1 Tax=Nonomuraea sp. NPDC050680 TaxID=3154630 RepID=UPI0033FA6C1D